MTTAWARPMTYQARMWRKLVCSNEARSGMSLHRTLSTWTREVLVLAIGYVTMLQAALVHQTDYFTALPDPGGRPEKTNLVLDFDVRHLHLASAQPMHTAGGPPAPSEAGG
ncbi:uncharacterized protein B0I36DRAFT_344765 [Microdochium trichocladiopsis]|uniref:Uncharacterized protein n=1 Tax=Microdochium trichocladiopsis TaxID=1682393 RepID=A0A9P8YIZ8_9PEZI|nr:uncharacterized protein B0I36DRAFT_344765 [Microdochium trichocladiopsis]KAH7041135.1 hypothetical protein B0I36DRAFT_344765 [Microdochium trichocladiopsis]